MKAKIRVGIIFGGKSAEHEISLLSALNIINSIGTENYESVLIGIDKAGVWFLCEHSSIVNADDPKRITLDTSNARRIAFATGSGGVIASWETGEYLEHIDVAFPMLHGSYGEDGTTQGLLRFAAIPFVGAGVLGGEEPIASVPGEIIPSHEFYSYEAKYIDEHGAELVIPARFSDEAEKKIQALAIKTFTTLECFGLARVDFFLTEHDEIFVNEINTLPGFTSHSMYPKLFEYGGVSCADIIDRLIRLAIKRFEREQKLKIT